MKVGILNVQWLNNYGSVLLAYAMQKKLDYLGVDNSIIDFRPYEFNQNGEIPSAHKGVKPSSHGKVSNFEKFRHDFLRRTKPVIGAVGAGSLDFDGYIVGSDTVWTPLKINDVEAYYFYLRFVRNKNVRKIAWSASIGSEKKDDLNKMRSILTEALKDFDYISIRERETASFVQCLTDKKVFHTMDPVLMLDKEDYHDVLPRRIDPNEKYLYAFMFNDLSGAYGTINEVSKRTGLKVVANVKHINRVENVLYNCEDDGPGEFVERIQNAEYIITDSYHGIIFAIMFKKPFVCYMRAGSGIRARNLLEDIGLENRFLLRDIVGTSLLLEDIDYVEVYNTINKWRRMSEQYLQHALYGFI